MIYIDFCSFWQHGYFDELYFFGLSGFIWDVILNQFFILQRKERKTHQQHFTADNTNNTHRSRLIWQTVFICAWVCKPFHLPFKLHKNIVFAILMREFGRCSVCHSQVVSYQFSIKPTFLFVSWCSGLDTMCLSFGKKISVIDLDWVDGSSSLFLLRIMFSRKCFRSPRKILWRVEAQVADSLKLSTENSKKTYALIILPIFHAIECRCWCFFNNPLKSSTLCSLEPNHVRIKNLSSENSPFHIS